MSRYTVVVVAALLAASPARAFQQTRGTGGEPLRWRTSSVPWFLNTCRPASSPSCQVGASGDPATLAVRAAFDAWAGATRAGETQACSGIALPYAGSSTSVAVGGGTSGQHLVVFRQGWCSSNEDARADSCFGSDSGCANKYNCFDDPTAMERNILALTTVMYTPSSGAIGDADMEVVDWGGLPGNLGQQPPDGWYWTCFDPAGEPICGSYGQGGCAFMDLQNTVTHEVGHFIGLAHPCESDSTTAQQNGVPLCSGHPEMASTTMYPSAAPREISKRTLEPDDVEGVCTVYPATAATALTAPAFDVPTVAAAASAETAYQCVPKPAASTQNSRGGSGGCGAGSATPVGLAALALGLALLLPRRRAARR